MTNRLRKLAIILLSLIFIGLLAGFGLSALNIRKLTTQLDPPAPSEPSGLRIELISQELNNPFWRSLESGAREAAESYGMELEYAGPTRIDPEEQTRLLEKAVAKGADALLVQGLNDPVYARLIDEAVRRGIPVVTVDADEPNSRRIAYVGSDNELAGAQMGELVARKLDGEGEIGVLLGSEATNQRLRLEGFRNVVSRYPGLSIADVRISNISRLQAAEQAAELLQEFPELRAIVGFSALDGLGIAEAVQRLGVGDVSVFAFDDLENTKEAIQSGKIEASVVQHPYRMGEEAVRLLHALLQGEPLGQSQHVVPTTVLARSPSAPSDGNGSGGE
ncbi:sugar-binding protein [Cohnella algarum]|uniref:sugar-binding protein n=1 Tax=Cohnella algarum TaxID=2044859 RepID=UPI001967F320|nr:sugar-binding protein [Cohnella algarum]MBN2983090.1 sugar-binding protein [Cohnella algarum]